MLEAIRVGSLISCLNCKVLRAFSCLHSGVDALLAEKSVFRSPSKYSYFHLSAFQSLLLLFHFRYSPNTLTLFRLGFFGQSVTWRGGGGGGGGGGGLLGPPPPVSLEPIMLGS